MLLRLGRIKAKGAKQKVRRSMLPVTRYTMKTVSALLFLLSTSVSPPLYSADVSKIFSSLLNSNRYRSFRDICIYIYICLSNLDERSNLVKLSRNEQVGRREWIELSKYRNENSESEESVCTLKRGSYSTGLSICSPTYVHVTRYIFRMSQIVKVFLRYFPEYEPTMCNKLSTCARAAASERKTRNT